MNAQDLIDSLAVSSLFLSYGKAAGKYLLFHLPALCLGAVSNVVSKPHTKEGDTMNPTEKRIDRVDYLAAHPFCIPFWVWMFIYMFMIFSTLGFVGVAFTLLFFAIWLRLYLASATRLFEYSAAEEPQSTPAALLAGVKP